MQAAGDEAAPEAPPASARPPALVPDASLAAVRVRGGVEARFARRGAQTGIVALAERGGYRLALPSTFASHLEAAQINTGGGVAGGDRIGTRLAVGAGADVVYATQGAERIYRSDGSLAVADVALTLEPGARLDWLPQQTVLYAGARLARGITADIAASSRLLMVEMLTFGRAAGGEGAEPAFLRDRWHIRRDGRLVFAEALRFSGEMAASLGRPAVGGGARSAAIVLLVAPDAEMRLEEARRALEDAPCEAAASAWNGMLTARLLAREPAACLAAVSRLAAALATRPMPRVWSI